jgi:(1->4)-alpha-D-glucan 1-alpha-D-glucosylmutase
VRLDAFHEACARALADWPRAMLATSTHDTKRSEDVRARLSVLSEMTGPWTDAVRRWAGMNERWKSNGFPDRNAEYLLYQTLVGAWPISTERVVGFMEKASREAKQHTTWTSPNEAYEEALRGFVRGILSDPAFVSDLGEFVQAVEKPGHITSLSLCLLKLTAPGVPDIYQGTELWDFSLVDPDNRRPVDYALRERLLKELEGMDAREAWRRREEGIPKLWLIRRALAARARHAEAYGEGSYRPLHAEGDKARHVVAFVRGGEMITVAPRLALGVSEGWGDTFLELPEGKWVNELTDEDWPKGRVNVGELLHWFPVALLSRKED